MQECKEKNQWRLFIRSLWNISMKAIAGKKAAKIASSELEFDSNGASNKLFFISENMRCACPKIISVSVWIQNFFFFVFRYYYDYKKSFIRVLNRRMIVFLRLQS